MSTDKLDFDTTANVESKWFINEDLDLAYFSAFASDSVPSDTSTHVGSDPWSAMNALTSLRAPIKSSLLVREKIGSAHNALFEVPTKRKGQKPILFGRIKIAPVSCESPILSLHNSFIMDQSHVTRWKEWSMILPRNQALISAKKNEHYFVHLYWKAKTLITITRPEKDSVM